MLQINCPFCGLRDETEFVFGGEANIVRPPAPEAVSDRAWSDYLYHRKNPKGLYDERWQHRFGCRQWFVLTRHTVSHEIHAERTMANSHDRSVREGVL